MTVTLTDLDKRAIFGETAIGGALEKDEMSVLYRGFAPQLLGSLQRRYPRAGDITDDAVQHAFLQLQMAVHPPDEPRAWLRTVAGHYVIDRLRADGRTVSDDEIISELPAGSAPVTRDTDEVSTTMVQRALAQLTTRAQRLLRGKYMEGRTYGTLARQEGIAKSGMGRILDRARERLRKAVNEMKRS